MTKVKNDISLSLLVLQGHCSVIHIAWRHSFQLLHRLYDLPSQKVSISPEITGGDLDLVNGALEPMVSGKSNDLARCASTLTCNQCWCCCEAHGSC